ncbi:transcription termination factor 1-like [Rhynchocyon petersi]
MPKSLWETETRRPALGGGCAGGVPGDLRGISATGPPPSQESEVRQGQDREEEEETQQAYHQKKMKGKPNPSEIHIPVADKKKKKKKHLTDQEIHQWSSTSFDDGCLENEQNQMTISKKKRENKQHLMSFPLNQSEISDTNERAKMTLKKKKKKRKGSLGVDKVSDVACVLVDKENIENTPKNLRRDIDVKYVDRSTEQKSAKDSKADKLPSVPTSCYESEEMHHKVRRKKHKKHHSTGASSNTQEDLPSSIALYQPESKEQESMLSLDLQEESPEESDKKKPKGKKKISNNPAFEALDIPERPENLYSDISQVISEVDTMTGSEVLEEIKESNHRKTKSKKRKRKSVESAIRAGADISVLSRVSLDSIDTEGDDLVAGEGTLVGESMKPRTKKKKKQSFAEENYAEEVQRLESSNEEESSFKSAEHSEACLSDDLRDSDDSDTDLSSAVKQLQEFIPNIKERAAGTIKRMYRDDLERFKEFKAQGVSIKFGKFSAKENKQLQQNVKEFLALTGIETADKLLHTDRYPEEKAMINDLKRKYAFRLHIGKDIARPWKLVYYRAQKMFHIHNYKGRYSEEDTEKVKRYHSLHGNDWKKIGELVSRSGLSVALKYSQISNHVNRGTWSKAETQRLVKAVEQVLLKKIPHQELKEMDSRLRENPEHRLSIVRDKLYRGISWIEVEAKVETRNWMQCKSKWTEVLTKRMNNGRDPYRGVIDLQAKINLIERLYETNVEDSNEIDWEDISGVMGDVHPSYALNKFHRLKATCVPFWQEKTFPEIIDYLYETILPLFKEKLEKKLEKEGTEIWTPAPPKKVFLLKDIFYSDDDSEEEEEVNEKNK